MALNTDHLARCIDTLEASLGCLAAASSGSIDHEIFRNAVVKSFELTLETAGKLLRKALKAYGAGNRAVDELTFKDVLRGAAKHGLLDTAAVERWFTYRANRNSTAHDYGEAFATQTLKLVAPFIEDARVLQQTLDSRIGET